MNNTTSPDKNQISIPQLETPSVPWRTPAERRLLYAIDQLSRHNLATQARIAAAAHLSVRHAQRLLAGLTTRGHISSRAVGRYRHYRLTSDEPILFQQNMELDGFITPDTPATGIRFTPTQQRIIAAILTLTPRGLNYRSQIARTSNVSLSHAKRLLAQMSDAGQLVSSTQKHRRYYTLSPALQHDIDTENTPFGTPNMEETGVIAHDTRHFWATLSPAARRTLKQLSDGRAYSRTQLANAVSCSDRHMTTILRQLVNAGTVHKTRAGHRMLFTLAEQNMEHNMEHHRAITRDMTPINKTKFKNTDKELRNSQLTLIENVSEQAARQLDIPVHAHEHLDTFSIPLIAAAETLMFHDDSGRIAATLGDWAAAWRTGTAPLIVRMRPTDIWRAILAGDAPPTADVLWKRAMAHIREHDTTLTLGDILVLRECRLEFDGGFRLIAPDLAAVEAVRRGCIRQVRDALAAVVGGHIGYVDVSAAVTDDRLGEPDLSDPVAADDAMSEFAAAVNDRFDAPAPPAAAVILDQLLTVLRGQMTRSMFRAVFPGATATLDDDGSLVIAVRTETAAAWLDDRLRANVERALHAVPDAPATFRVAVAVPTRSA